MNEQELRAVLAVAMAYDNRKPGEANIAAWLTAADRGRWTFADAVEAVHDHYAKSPDFLMPAHVTTFIRAKMRQPQPVGEAIAELESGPPASEATRRRVMEQIRRFADKFKPPDDAA